MTSQGPHSLTFTKMWYLLLISWLIPSNRHLMAILKSHRGCCLVTSLQRTLQWSHSVTLMWISFGDTIVSSPWPLYCGSDQMTSQRSRIISLLWLIFRNSAGHRERCFVTSHPMTSFWCHFRTRYSVTVMVESPKDNHVKGTRYIVTSLSNFSQVTASVNWQWSLEMTATWE